MKSQGLDRSSGSKHMTAGLLALLLLLLGTACSSVSGGTQAPSTSPSGSIEIGPGRKIDSVTVVLNEELLPSNVTLVANQYEVARILDSRVREQLAAHGLAGDGPYELEVDIIGMRLRSNGTAIWWGFMAGADWITVNVTVKQNGNEVRSFQTGTSTSLGGFALGGRSTRVGRMMKTLGVRIAEGI
jgi:hypothetical protein